MKWFFSPIGGQWDSFSEINLEDSPVPTWRIAVCEDGTFDVSESDTELIELIGHFSDDQERKEIVNGKVKTFPNLNDAKEFCEVIEGRGKKHFADA